MAWATMHFAAGMIGGAAACTLAGFWRPVCWRWAAPVMTGCGAWAMLPDVPRMVREDGGSLPLLWRLGSRSLDAWLHRFGDVFFLHRMLDAQPHEHALLGLGLIIFCFNAGWLLGKLADRHPGAIARRREYPGPCVRWALGADPHARASRS